MVLADEVGLGKTYVALGVAAWVLMEDPSARVCVLAHNREMVETWTDRWSSIRLLRSNGNPGASVTEPVSVHRAEEFLQRASEPQHRLVLASYEQLKGLRLNAAARGRLGHWLFQRRHHHSRFHKTVRRRLLRDLDLPNDGWDGRVTQMAAREGASFWERHYDWDRRVWRNAKEARKALHLLEIESRVLGDGDRPPFDLTIIDEAHKLDSDARDRAIKALLSGRTRRVLYVTATPFALDVSQLRDLFSLFGLATGADAGALEAKIDALDLRGYEKAVESRATVFPRRESMEAQLRRWIVRRTWAKAHEALARVPDPWRVLPSGGREVLSELCLGRAIAEVLRAGGKTHIASRRASFCSSYAAARESLTESPLEVNSEAEAWSAAAKRMMAANAGEAPKVVHAAKRIADIVCGGTRDEHLKVLVFSDRAQTLKVLEKELARELERRLGKRLGGPGGSGGAKLGREIVNRAQSWIRARREGRVEVRCSDDEKLSAAEQDALLRLAAGSLPGRALRTVQEAKAWISTLAPGSKVKAVKAYVGHWSSPVEIYDGSHKVEERLKRFNLPGTPWVLLCSRSAQEAIDLHEQCSTVVLFDPVWNPAHREQRIGRVQRATSTARRIRVVDVVAVGAYDQVIHERASRRAKMMSTLLGAGRWLDQDREVDRLEPFEMNLDPEASAKDPQGALADEAAWLSSRGDAQPGRLRRLLLEIAKAAAPCSTQVLAKVMRLDAESAKALLLAAEGTYVHRSVVGSTSLWSLTDRGRWLAKRPRVAGRSGA